ncbi:glycoside hydrolase family 2 protein [Tropicimonas isoalkanivorans]|uniref:glycoside hydrolase family 2 protein n=1 Tax=Tropicimonas isoalkanivorans TaxID=441112 RepID=UPI000B83C357
MERRNGPAGEEVLLTSDRPAFYVSWDLGGDTIWSDNGFTLLPGRPKILRVERKRTSHLPATEPEVRYLKG